MLDKRSLQSQATDLLRQDILRGQYPPAHRLTEFALSKQFGLSRSTARGGLQQLEAEGLVHRIPYTGWEIPSLNEHDLWELQTLRGVLEGLAARLAAERIQPDGKTRLDRAYALLCKAGTSKRRKDVMSFDWGLHQTIAELSGNGRLFQHYKLVEQQVRLHIAITNARYDDLEAIATSHGSVVAAIVAGDGDKAELFARSHNADNDLPAAAK
jgi:DNA-binding GntR family transcriptional regulator